MELSSTVDLALGKVVSILENEVFLLREVGTEIDEIKAELNAMKAFLRDAARSGAPSYDTDNHWITSVRDTVFEVEDVIDEFMYHFNEQQQYWRDQPASFFSKLINFPKNLLVKHRLAAKLQDTNKKIKSIAERSLRYRASLLESGKSNRQIGGEMSSDWVKNLSESSLFLEDDDVVGIDKAQRRLLGWLMDQKLQRTVISVVGMGGLGKTTLAANTFNKQIVKQHFDCCAWITVSQQYVVKELLKSMIKELYHKAKEKIDSVVINVDSMSYRDLVEALVSFLKPRRYLIVIDDVWSTNLWQEISSALPKNTNRSRILLTTRRKDVASFEFGVEKHILPLDTLPAEESWALFSKKAFAGKGGHCPPYLVSIARNLVAKCQGLPLAIVALGGLMASKKSIAEWNGIYDNFSWELSENNILERLKYISLLSYHDLSYRLKHCFLYCSIFPEDCLIGRKRLIRLWMAEGFVEPLMGTPPEAVAERYLIELICRGLLQVVGRNGSGRPKRFKMHDILRNFAVTMSKSEKFVAKSDGTEEVEDNGIWRLSIEAKGKEMKAANKAALSRVRSLFVFAVDETSRSSFNRLPEGFKLLRVLDLEDTPINELPDELMEKLFNLRYLNLNRTGVKELPESIGKLYNLQSLLMRGTPIKQLPAGIVKLKNLRYLIAYSYKETGMEFDSHFGIVVPSDFCLLNSLHVLSLPKATDNFIKQLGRMTQLRRLCITDVKESHGNDLCLAIAKMRQLRYFGVKTGNEDEQVKMDALESPPPYLEKLVLVGKLEKVPHWFNSLNSLTYLYFHWTRLGDDFLPYIQALPNLGEMLLVNAYEGERLDFLEGFQKLKILSIWGSPRLKGIVISKGVMPGLQELHIWKCQELMTLPHGWESLRALKQVYFEDVSPGLMKKILRSTEMDQQTIIAMMLSREEGGEVEFNIKYWVR